MDIQTDVSYLVFHWTSPRVWLCAKWEYTVHQRNPRPRERLVQPFCLRKNNMPPEKLKLAKEMGHKEIFLSLARVKDSSRLFLGASDGKVYDIDLIWLD